MNVIKSHKLLHRFLVRKVPLSTAFSEESLRRSVHVLATMLIWFGVYKKEDKRED